MLKAWQPQTTADGSITFFSPEFQETFHSSSGAEEEALHKFVMPSGLATLAQEWIVGQTPLKILDVCYGLGYNTAAALATIWQVNPACAVEVLAWELELTVPQAALGFLKSYPPPIPELLTTLATELKVDIPRLQGRLEIGDARKTIQRSSLDWRADVIFLDPFSPPKCPQLWSIEFLALLAQHLQPQGKIITYSCAAAVRTALLQAGLYIASTPSVGRKNPGTIASPSPLEFPPLTSAELEYLQTRAAVPYQDPHLKDEAATIRQRRTQEQTSSHLEPTSKWKKRWSSPRAT
ncbi:MAG: hypothetical protein HC916_21845 [Coleofasciculaceae cyanobacterium SM2_1_6]|nr:hypothetical protein [Coleofasciculaceae cyanobacterium SM2_1_6]